MDFLPNDNSSGFAHINSRVCGVVCVCAHASTHKSLRIFVRTHVTFMWWPEEISAVISSGLTLSF